MLGTCELRRGSSRVRGVFRMLESIVCVSRILLRMTG